MTKLLEFLERHTAHYLFRSSHLKEHLWYVGSGITGVEFGIPSPGIRIISFGGIRNPVMQFLLDQKFAKLLESVIKTWG